MSGEETCQLFSSSNEFTMFDAIKHQTTANTRSFDITAFENTPVEMYWYFQETTGAEPVINHIPALDEAQRADVQAIRLSITSRSCGLRTVEALARLATVVKDSDGHFVLNPKLPVKRENVIVSEPTALTNQDNRIQMEEVLLETSRDDPPPAVQPLDDSMIPEYSFFAAFFVRYAYKLAEGHWNERMTDFKLKFKDLTGKEFTQSLPSEEWARSLNSISRDLKHKFRCLIYQIIMNSPLAPRPEPMNESRAKFFRYLFATPFSYYGLTPFIQLKRAADALEINVSQLMSALSLNEFTPGINLLTKILSEAAGVPFWPYCRAFDDTFFSSMSTLAVKKVHTASLVIINLKGGQQRPINLDAIKSLAVVKDKPLIIERVLDVITYIDLQTKKTAVAEEIDRAKAGQDRNKFMEHREMYKSSLANQLGTKTINKPKLISLAEAF